jgi:hypothetical protein
MATGKKQGPKATKTARGATKTNAMPTAADLADFMGLTLRAPLKAKQTQQLLKPLPGYRAIMDNVAQYLDEGNHLLKLKYTEADVLEHLVVAKDRTARVNVLAAVLASCDAERQTEDGFLMKVLLDCVKRVREQGGAHPELLVKWQEVRAVG